MSISRRGFTIVELFIVIAIICILAGVAIPPFHSASRAAQQRRISPMPDEKVLLEAQKIADTLGYSSRLGYSNQLWDPGPEGDEGELMVALGYLRNQPLSSVPREELRRFLNEHPSKYRE